MQGSSIEPLGFFLHTGESKEIQEMQFCDLRSCKDGIQTRRIMYRLQGSVHPCNTKDITKGVAKPCWFPSNQRPGIAPLIS